MTYKREFPDYEEQPICPLKCKECGVEYEMGFNDSLCTEDCANRYIDGMKEDYDTNSKRSI